MSDAEPLAYLRTARLTVFGGRDAGSGARPSAFFERFGTGTVIPGGTDGFHMTLSIEKSLQSDPNTCDITIQNLGERTRKALAGSNLIASLEVGYGQVSRVIFTGDVAIATSAPKDTEWVTKLRLADGGRAYQLARVPPRSFAAGTTYATAVRATIESLGMEMPATLASAPELQRKFQSGVALSGDSADQLTKLLAPFALGWSIQGGRILVLRTDEVRPGQLYLINAQNGMIESPEYGTPDKKGKAPALTVRALLRPEIEPGSVVRVESKVVTGTFKVEKVAHKGDTDSGDNATEIEARPL